MSNVNPISTAIKSSRAWKKASHNGSHYVVSQKSEHLYFCINKTEHWFPARQGVLFAMKKCQLQLIKCLQVVYNFVNNANDDFQMVAQVVGMSHNDLKFDAMCHIWEKWKIQQQQQSRPWAQFVFAAEKASLKMRWLLLKKL